MTLYNISAKHLDLVCWNLHWPPQLGWRNPWPPCNWCCCPRRWSHWRLSSCRASRQLPGTAWHFGTRDMICQRQEGGRRRLQMPGSSQGRGQHQEPGGKVNVSIQHCGVVKQMTENLCNNNELLCFQQMNRRNKAINNPQMNCTAIQVQYSEHFWDWNQYINKNLNLKF